MADRQVLCLNFNSYMEALGFTRPVTWKSGSMNGATIFVCRSISRNLSDKS